VPEVWNTCGRGRHWETLGSLLDIQPLGQVGPGLTHTSVGAQRDQLWGLRLGTWQGRLARTLGSL
jgi:hypothetical protein